MILADFKLKPLKGSKFYTRIRIFDTRRNMLRTAHAEDSIRGKAKACFSGFLQPERGKIADVYLYDNKIVGLDTVHELTHIAVHYVRNIGHGDLGIAATPDGASPAEELLCRCCEYMIPQFTLEFARFRGALDTHAIIRA